MVYLVDTNILLRFADRAHPLHPSIRAAVRQLRADGHRLMTTTQNYVEFWNVATRPANRNGLGLTPADADRLLRLVERLFPSFTDSPAVYPEWRRLVVSYGVCGVQVHDARLAAVMIVHGVTHILTLNTADFVRYAPTGIVTVDPHSVQLAHWIGLGRTVGCCPPTVDSTRQGDAMIGRFIPRKYITQCLPREESASAR